MKVQWCKLKWLIPSEIEINTHEEYFKNYRITAWPSNTNVFKVGVYFYFEKEEVNAST
jgi:hypothetical protein